MTKLEKMEPVEANGTIGGKIYKSSDGNVYFEGSIVFNERDFGKGHAIPYIKDIKINLSQDQVVKRGTPGVRWTGH